jgi:hypothetical protein
MNYLESFIPVGTARVVLDLTKSKNGPRKTTVLQKLGSRNKIKPSIYIQVLSLVYAQIMNAKPSQS